MKWQSIAAASSLAALLALAGPAAAAAQKCEAVRILKDGRQVPTRFDEPETNAWTGTGRAGTASAQAGSASSSSSVHVSSSSRGGGTAKAVASYTDALGRTVTKTSDEHGCRIVIDERGL